MTLVALFLTLYVAVGTDLKQLHERLNKTLRLRLAGRFAGLP